MESEPEERSSGIVHIVWGNGQNEQSLSDLTCGISEEKESGKEGRNTG